MNLTSEQIQAIRQGEPVRVVLPEIGEECVVLRAADFEVGARGLEGLDPKQAYPAIDEAWKDDWEFPGMADYDHTDPLDRFSAICERDVDLLLLEEFNCNPSFCDWFLLLLRPSSPSPVHSCVARHSVVSSGEAAGESDLEIVFALDASSGARSVLVLLEDKVSARFTADQPARYQGRKELAIHKKIADECYTVLLAPKAYLEPLNCFDVRVPYEDVEEFFEGRADRASDETRARYHYRAALLRHAIEGRPRTHDEERTRFFYE